MQRIHTLHLVRSRPFFDVHVHCALDEHKKVVAEISLGEHGLVWLELQELARTAYRSQLRVRVRLEELALHDGLVDVLDVSRGAGRTRHLERRYQLLEALTLAAGQ